MPADSAKEKRSMILCDLYSTPDLGEFAPGLLQLLPLEWRFRA
jgi:hypothetical protein